LLRNRLELESEICIFPSQYFKSYIAIYKGNELPEPKSMLVATAEANNLTAAAAAKDMYVHKMEDLCGGNQPYIKSNNLDTAHKLIRDGAIQQVSFLGRLCELLVDDFYFQFVKTRKMGGDDFSQKYLDKLELDIDEAYTQYKAANESKNIFKAARTPGVYFVIAIVMYVLSGVFGLVGLYVFANFCNLVMGIALLTLAMWAYIK
jgi:atlastin